jgi:hypothetical protein
MSRVKALAADLRALPEKERRKNLVGLLGRMQQNVEEAAATLADATVTAAHAAEFIEPAVASTVRDHAVKAARQAVQLQRLLTDYDNVAMNGPVDDAVSKIAEWAKASRKAVRDRWRAWIEERAQGYDALAGAAEQARLPGRGEMRQSVERFKSAGSQPPATATAALKVRADQDALKTAIEQLGIQGVVGEFLVAASQGRGDPKHLLRQEVAAFLDANPDLWRLLQVKLA